MKNKKRKFNIIKARHSYSTKELAETLNLHAGTVYLWIKQGLKIIETSSKPYLILGEEIKQFLKEKKQKRKHQLSVGEFFCPKCHKARKSLPNKISVEYTNRKLGKVYKQVIIKGVCEVCGQKFFRFSSDRQIKEWQEKNLLFKEHKETIYGNGDNCVNNNIVEAQNE